MRHGGHQTVKLLYAIPSSRLSPSPRHSFTYLISISRETIYYLGGFSTGKQRGQGWESMGGLRGNVGDLFSGCGHEYAVVRLDGNP